MQVDLAQSFSGGRVPITGGFFENIKAQFTGGMFEAPKSSRTEMDKNAVSLYENLEVFVEEACKGVEAHSVMYGSAVGRLAGIWLGSRANIEQALVENDGLGKLLRDDDGA